MIAPVAAPAAERAGSQTLLRGLDVIDALADGPLPLRALAAALALTPASTRRLAAALVARGVLTLNGRRGYGLGPRLLAWGQAAEAQHPLGQVARPWLAGLAEDTLDTVVLTVRDGDRAVCIEYVGGRRRINVVSRLGQRLSLTSSAPGLALLLDQSAADWARLYAATHLAAADLEPWLARLSAFQAAGATRSAGDDDGVGGVAAPVRDVAGQIVAAVGVWAVAQYLPEGRADQLAARVSQAAAALSRDLGWSAGRPR